MLAPQLTNAHASATRAHHRASSAPLCTSQPRKLPPRAANCRRCLQNELCESSLELCRLDGLMARARMRYTLGRPRITSVVRIDKRSRGIVTLRKLTRRSTDYSLLCTHCRLCKLGNNDCKHMFQTRASLLTGLRASAREIVPTPGTRARRAGEPVSWPVRGKPGPYPVGTLFFSLLSSPHTFSSQPFEPFQALRFMLGPGSLGAGARSRTRLCLSDYVSALTALPPPALRFPSASCRDAHTPHRTPSLLL